MCKCRNELYLFHVQSTDYAQALPRTHNTNTARAARGANVKGGDMLTGQYQRSLDSKIRVTLPAPQRKQLGDVVILLRRQDALYGYSPEAYEAWIASLNLNPRNRDDVTALRMLNAAATTVDIDSAGALLWERLTSPIHRLGRSSSLTAMSPLSVTATTLRFGTLTSGTASSRQMTALQRSRTSSLAPSEARRS